MKGESFIMTEMSGVIRSIDMKIQALDRKQVPITKHMIELHRKEERLTLARLMRREFLDKRRRELELDIERPMWDPRGRRQSGNEMSF